MDVVGSSPALVEENICGCGKYFLSRARPRRCPVVAEIPAVILCAYVCGVVSAADDSFVDDHAAQVVRIISVEAQEGLEGHVFTNFLRAECVNIEVPAFQVQDQDLRLAHELGFLSASPVRKTLFAVVTSGDERLVSKRVREEGLDTGRSSPGHGQTKGGAHVMLKDQVRAGGAACSLVDQGAKELPLRGGVSGRRGLPNAWSEVKALKGLEVYVITSSEQCTERLVRVVLPVVREGAETVPGGTLLDNLGAERLVPWKSCELSDIACERAKEAVCVVARLLHV